MRTADPRKRVLVVASHGGGAHASASAAVASYLEPDYAVRRVDPITDVFASLDPLRWLTLGRRGGEDLYNWLLARGWHRVATLLCDRYGAPVIRRKEERLVRLFTEHLERDRPDLIVSVMPLINSVLLESARHVGVPLLVVPVDLDTSNYVNGLSAPSYEGFRYALAFGDAMLRQHVAPARIPAEQVRVTGFPVRPAFLERADRAALRASLGLPLDRPVVFVIMGAAGGYAMLRYARALESLPPRAHVVLCAGRNARLERRLAAMPAPHAVSRTVLGFTPHVADYMRAADVVVTKPGPATICEAIYAEVPVVLDCSTPFLRWERLNAELVHRYGLGARVGSPREAQEVVTRWLGDEGALEAMRAQLSAFPKPHFGRALHALVEELAGPRTLARLTVATTSQQIAGA